MRKWGRMPKFRTLAWVTASVLLVPAFAAAQSLGDAAAKEKDKKKAAKPVKVYTEDDLKRAGGNGAYSAPEGPASTDASPKPADGKAPAAGAKDKTDDELKAEKAAAWRKDRDKAQADVAARQKVVDDIQTAMSASTSYYDPSRVKAAGDLDQAKAKLAEAQQAVADLEETGRRNGYR
jgi:hypothetical protein